MNSYHIKYFVDSVKLKSIQGSALCNNVTHSAVSLAIRTLERELGFELLEHSKRIFRVTERGHRVFDEFLNILAKIDFLKSELPAENEPLRGELRIMAPQSLFVKWFSDVLVIFQKNNPGVKIKILSGAAHMVREQLQLNSIDLGLMIDDHKTHAFHSICLRKGTFKLAHSSRFKGNWQELDLLVSSIDKIEVDFLLKKLKKNKYILREPRLEIVSWSLIKDMILKKSGLGYLPDYLIGETGGKEGLKLVEDLDPLFGYEILAVWSKEQPLKKAALSLLGAMRKI